MDITHVKSELDKFTTSYYKIDFPLFYYEGDDTFRFGGVVFDGFSPDGMTYMLYRLGAYVDRKKARKLYSEDKQKFVTYINHCRDVQVSSSFHESERETFYGAFVTQNNKMFLWGLLTHYNPVSHKDVVDVVDKSEILSELKSARVSPKELRLFFSNTKVVNDRVHFGMAVRNGETGHCTLSYRLAVESDDYMFLFPTDIRRRHLSKVADVDLVSAFDMVKTIELDNILKTTPTSLFRPDWLKEGPDYYYDLFVLNSNVPIQETLISIIRKRDEKGFKTFGNKLMDHIYMKAGEIK